MASTTPQPPVVIAPGNHDGVHPGHQALLRRARDLATERGCKTAALTFDPHPASVLAPDRAPMMLTTQTRRAQLLRAAGADEVLVQPFTRQFAAQSPQEFLAGLCDRGAQGIVVGPDFRFGRGRAGDVATVEQFARTRDLVVAIESPVEIDGQRVSSSAIREALARGDLNRANRLLGRVHDLEGTVIEGDHRGRTLGFPTANLETDPVQHPADGVYSVVARRTDRDERWQGIASIGVRPTFKAGRSVEVHLFDFDENLYGACLRVGFVARVRAERAFDGPEALKAQIELDCGTARDTLASVDGGLLRWI